MSSQRRSTFQTYSQVPPASLEGVRLSFRRLHPEGVFCAAGNGKVSSCAAAEGSFTALTGLLEVEPLHFTCISTSDGTRVERDDASIFTGKLHLPSPQVRLAHERLFTVIVLFCASEYVWRDACSQRGPCWALQ